MPALLVVLPEIVVLPVPLIVFPNVPPVRITSPAFDTLPPILFALIVKSPELVTDIA